LRRESLVRIELIEGEDLGEHESRPPSRRRPEKWGPDAASMA